MSENDMVMSSAAEKFSSLASRFATIFCTVGSKFVVFDHTKIAFLQTLIVTEADRIQSALSDLSQR